MSDRFMYTAMFSGMFLGASMIVPLGVQNSYVLSQGIKREHHFTIATICMLCDILLISLGIFGGGQLITSSNTLMLIIGWGGFVFLMAYACIAFRSFWINDYQQEKRNFKSSSKKKVIVTTLALTLLNPHVYLDTVMILGSVGGAFQGKEKLAFAIGTFLASIIWFYSLAGGAAKLAPWLDKPSVRRWIDFFIGIVMLVIAGFLLQTTLVK